MGAILTTIITSLHDFLQALVDTLRAPFQDHSCQVCGCENYSDEELFIWLREQSSLQTYADTMLASDILNKPLKCSRCKHGRSQHGTLSARLLTAEMLPNGGVVYAEEIARREQQRRANRFAGQNVQVGDATMNEDSMQVAPPSSSSSSSLSTSNKNDDGNKKNETKEIQAQVVNALSEVKTSDVKMGSGIEVRNGSEVLVHYDAFVRASMEKFESSRGGRALCLTVGRGDVVKGWDQGIVGMRVGGRRRIEVPSELAFGAAKVMGNRNVDVVFDVRVEAVTST